MARPKRALDQIADRKSLKAVWGEMFHSISKKRRAHMSPEGISPNHFQEMIENKVASISRDLKQKTYSFDDLDPVFLPKNSGGYRVINVPSIKDRLTQRAILSLLRDRGPDLSSNVSFGFQKGSSVTSAILMASELRKKNPWVIKTDIQKFFDCIPRDLLIGEIERRVRISSIHWLLIAAAKCEVKKRSGVDDKLEKLGINRGVGVRQGMPMSPYFSNLILKDFDDSIQRRGIRMVRYADDIAVFCRSKKEANNIFPFIEEKISEVKLSIPGIYDGSKTEIVPDDSPLDFLGVCVAGQRKEPRGNVFIGSGQVDKMKERIGEYRDIKFCLARGVTLNNYMRKIDSIIGGYSGAYSVCENIDNVLMSLEHTALSNYRKLLRREFGIQEEKLKDHQRDFLGIHRVV